MFKFKNPLILATLLFTTLVPVHAQEEETEEIVGYGVIKIDQHSPQEGILGDWTLIKPGNRQQRMTDKETYTINGAIAGNYTLIVEPPAGASTFIDIHRADKKETIERRQISFTIVDAENVEIDIHYTFTKVGIVSVNSQPNGMQFTLTGPNDMEFHGTTPDSFQNVPEGQYSVTFDPIEGCVTPRPQSQRLEKDSRVAFTITISCENLDDLPQEVTEERTLEHVHYTSDGRTVILSDVKVKDWFAPHVHRVAKAKIMTGKTDAAGNPTGIFAPGDNVTIAQLAKIAHEVAGLDEKRRDIPSRPTNTRAQGTWAAHYFASAEYKDWLVFRDTRVDPGRPATRGEVVATLLQALDVPRNWPHGLLFTDVRTDTKYAASIETAAADRIIAGYTQRDGSSLSTFGPENPINRAEMSKVVSGAIDAYIEDTAEFTGDSLD